MLLLRALQGNHAQIVGLLIMVLQNITNKPRIEPSSLFGDSRIQQLLAAAVRIGGLLANSPSTPAGIDKAAPLPEITAEAVPAAGTPETHSVDEQAPAATTNSEQRQAASCQQQQERKAMKSSSRARKCARKNATKS